MKDPRIQKMARNILRYSVRLQPRENLLIELFDEGEDIAAAFIKEAYALGANPFLSVKNRTLLREILFSCNDDQIERMAALEADRMSSMQAYVVIRGSRNSSDWSDVPSDKMNLYQSLWFKKVHTEIRVPKTKWCIIRYPSHSMAQMANMSTEAFEDFYFNVCTLDYEKMSQAMEPLMELMQKTDKVRILGQGTDLSFSIKDMPIMRQPVKSISPTARCLQYPSKPLYKVSSPTIPPQNTRAIPMKMCAWSLRKERSSKPPPTIRPESTKYWIPTKAPAISANLPSVSTLISQSL